MKNIRFFASEIFQFLEVKVSIYLNRSVFVMIIGLLYYDKHSLFTYIDQQEAEYQ